MTDTSIQKAREAQQKFEQAKVNFEQAKEKIEAATARTKAAQQRITEIRASFKPAGGIKGGGIAAIVAILVGNLRAQLVLRIQKEVINILSKFTNQCPSSRDLQRIIKTRNNLLNNINSFQKRLDKLSSISRKILTTVTIVRRIIRIITSIPAPTAVAGVGIPILTLTKYSDALIKLNKTLDRLIAEAAAINVLTGSVAAIIQTLQNRLNAIDVQIQACTENPTQVLEQVSVAESSSNTVPEDSFFYKGYKLEIVQDVVDFKLAPKRRAIAIDRGGTVRLSGPSSFSSSTQILLDELKFRIDQLL